MLCFKPSAHSMRIPLFMAKALCSISFILGSFGDPRMLFSWVTDVLQFPSSSLKEHFYLKGKSSVLLSKASCCGIESYIWKVYTGIFFLERSLSAVIFLWNRFFFFFTIQESAGFHISKSHLNVYTS